MNLFEISDLEQFRLKSLMEIKKASPWLKDLAEIVLDRPIYRVEAIGSVTDPVKFNEDSDVDIGFYTRSDSTVPSEELTEKLRQHLIDYQIGSFGVADCIVYD